MKKALLSGMLCPSWLRSGSRFPGQIPLVKKMACFEFQKSGVCSWGERCKFLHQIQHEPDTTSNMTTTLSESQDPIGTDKSIKKGPDKSYIMISEIRPLPLKFGDLQVLRSRKRKKKKKSQMPQTMHRFHGRSFSSRTSTKGRTDMVLQDFFVKKCQNLGKI